MLVGETSSFTLRRFHKQSQSGECWEECSCVVFVFTGNSLNVKNKHLVSQVPKSVQLSYCLFLPFLLSCLFCRHEMEVITFQFTI